jgi:pectin methylesterase-like acyl-CoA thioesterase
MKHKTGFTVLIFCISIGLALTWVLAARVSRVAADALAAQLHVCLSGCAYDNVQAAVDAADEGDIIKVAEGAYTGVSARDGVTQMV